MKKMSLLVLLAVMAISLSLTGCGGGSNFASVTPSLPITGGHAPSFDLTVTPKLALFTEVESMARGEQLKLIANNEGTKVEEYDALHIASHMESGVAETIFQTVDPSVRVGYGHSGSPLYTKDGRLIGAVYSGIDGSREVFVRSIEQMAPLLYTTEPKSRSFDQPMPTNGTKWLLSGLPEDRAAQMIGTKWAGKIVSIGQMTGRSRQAETFTMRPGSTVAVVLVSGDDVEMTAYGTITYTPDGGEKWVGFGHPMEQMGVRNLPIFGASVDSVPQNAAFGTFKLCHVIGTEPIGTLTGDHAEGIVIDMTKTPAMTPAFTSVAINGKLVKLSRQRVARDFGSRTETMGAQNALIGPLYNLDDQAGTWWATAELRYSIDGSPVTVNYALPEAAALGMVRGGPSIQSQTGAKSVLDIAYALSSLIYAQFSGIEQGKSFDSLSLTVDITSTPPPIPGPTPGL